MVWGFPPSKLMLNFWLQVGDRVTHIKDAGSSGTVTHIDDNLIEGYSVTTCLVVWDGCDEPDIQWTNKLEKIGNYRQTNH